MSLNVMVTTVLEWKSTQGDFNYKLCKAACTYVCKLLVRYSALELTVIVIICMF